MYDAILFVWVNLWETSELMKWRDQMIIAENDLICCQGYYQLLIFREPFLEFEKFSIVLKFNEHIYPNKIKPKSKDKININENFI